MSPLEIEATDIIEKYCGMYDLDDMCLEELVFFNSQYMSEEDLTRAEEIIEEYYVSVISKHSRAV